MLFLLILSSIFYLGFVSSSEIIIDRIAPEEVLLGQSFEVVFSLNNQFDEIKQVILTESLINLEPLDNFDKLIFSESFEGIVAVRHPYYLWELNLAANDITYVSYSVNATFLGETNFGIARVYTNDAEYESEVSVLKVLCNQNNLCEENEDFFNCPHDCSSGGEDGTCDLVNDGIVDPDCEPGFDSSEIIDYCKNEILDYDEEGVDCGGICINECNFICPQGFFRIFSSCKNKEQRVQEWKTGIISTNTLMQDIKYLILPSL